MVELFRKYGDRYDMDHLLMMAQSFQESQLDHSARSHVGAIGIMQIMPATGKELKVGDIKVLDNNVNGGVKYMRFMIDQYYAKEPMTPLNKGLFAFAAYNAGPGRVAQLRKEAAKRGLDPNRWFRNVELVAAEKIGGETVTYVSNIYKYYTTYKLIEAQEAERRKAARRSRSRAAVRPGPDQAARRSPLRRPSRQPSGTSTAIWVAKRTATKDSICAWPTAAVAISVATAKLRAGNPHTSALRSSAERAASRATRSPVASIAAVKAADAPR